MNIKIEQTQHLFPKKFSNGWYLISITRYGELAKYKLNKLEDFWGLWKSWETHLSLSSNTKFKKSIGSIVNQFQTDCILNILFTLGFIAICWVTLLATSLNHMHSFLVYLFSPIIIISLFFQAKHLLFDKIACEFILEKDRIIILFVSGKMKYYKYDDIIKAQLDITKTLPFMEFRDGFKETKIIEYSNSPVLIEQLSKKVSLV